MHHGKLGILAVVALMGACDFPTGEYCEGEWAALPLQDDPPMQQSRVVAQVLPAEHKAVDLLFVIDDSRSMTDEQRQLGAWASELFDVLSPSGQLPDLHVAVTSSSISIPDLLGCEVGNDGYFHVGSAMLEHDRFVRDIAGPAGRERNYQGSLTEAFAKMALVGDSGCGYEQPFKAAKLALSGGLPGSQGFLRDDALLLVVFVTDEDDCSATDPLLFSNMYADACSPLGPLTSYRCFEHGVRCYDGKGSRAFGDREHCRPDENSPYMESVSEMGHYLKSLKKDPAQVIVAGIYGKPNQVKAIFDEKITGYSAPRLANVCRSGGEEGTGATPAIRMNALMREFAARASQSSICESELSWAMREVGLITQAVATRSHCLHGSVIDVDANAPGIQPACRVEAVRDAGSPRETRVKLSPCGTHSGDARCFTVEPDSLACADTTTQLSFRVKESSSSNESLVVACDVPVDAPDRLVPEVYGRGSR